RTKPRRATINLIRRGHAVAPGHVLAGKTAADGRHVNAGVEFRLAHSASLLKPPEKGLPGCPRKGPPEHRLLGTGRLSHAHHPGENRTATDCRPMHPGATRAGAQ